MRLTTLLFVAVFVAGATVACIAEPAGTMDTVPTAPTGAGPTTTLMTSEVEAFNTNFVMAAYGIDRSTIMSMRNAGWSWGDIYFLANIAAEARQPVLTIASLRSQGMSYSDIAARYNLTTSQILIPSPVRTMVAGYTAEYGQMPAYYLTDPFGNPVLTRYEAERLTMMGYTWRNIAIAANISARTGMSVRDVLSWIDRGYTWPQIARMNGLDPDEVMDVSRYPFMFRGTTTIPPAGAGPMEPVVPPPSY